MEEVLRDIRIQVLEIKYVINLGQLLKIVPNIKRYIFKLVKFVHPIQPKHACATVVIDHQMVGIQVQVGKNFIDDVLVDGGPKVNIIIIKSVKT